MGRLDWDLDFSTVMVATDGDATGPVESKWSQLYGQIDKCPKKTATENMNYFLRGEGKGSRAFFLNFEFRLKFF